MGAGWGWVSDLPRCWITRNIPLKARREGGQPLMLCSRSLALARVGLSCPNGYGRGLGLRLSRQAVRGQASRILLLLWRQLGQRSLRLDRQPGGRCQGAEPAQYDRAYPRAGGEVQ